MRKRYIVRHTPIRFGDKNGVDTYNPGDVIIMDDSLAVTLGDNIRPLDQEQVFIQSENTTLEEISTAKPGKKSRK